MLRKSGQCTPQDLKQFPHVYKGWLWRVQELVYGVDESGLYDEAIYKARYERHNANVTEYFRHRPDNLLILNLSDAVAMRKLGEFLGLSCDAIGMPHLNRSD